MAEGNVDYLGDGVYVKLEHGSVVLMANDHNNPTDTIYLDGQVMQALMTYLGKVIVE